MECAVSDTMRLTAPLPGNGGGAVFYWYALSGAYAPAVPLFGFAIFPRPGEIFPKGGALGKEGKLFLYPLYSFALAIC